MLDKTINSSKKKVSFHTLGCRLNFSETGTLAKGFEDRGYEIVPFGKEADVVMVNTCTVTDSADSTCRNLIRKAHKSSPEGKIVVVGCYAQMDPKAVANIKGVDLILGTSEKFKIFDYLQEEYDQIINVDKTAEFWGSSTTSADNHTRAFLKIQDGCNYVCSFCIIPQARGRSRAIDPKEAITQARDLLGQGFKEIILTGVNIGEYEEATKYPFHHLVEEILQLDGLERLRLSSVEPNTVTEDLIRVLKQSPKSMDHFHIPLQSGSDTILQKMRRKYSISEYKEIIQRVKEAFPTAGIGADIMVGHPGEGEKEFLETFNLLRDLPITHYHLFPFSKRKGTLSARMEDQVHSQTKKERMSILSGLGDSKLNLLMQDMVGLANNVLFEKRNKAGLFEGYTSNFLRVEVETDLDLKNQIRPVKISSTELGKLKGEL